MGRLIKQINQRPDIRHSTGVIVLLKFLVIVLFVCSLFILTKF